MLHNGGPPGGSGASPGREPAPEFQALLLIASITSFDGPLRSDGGAASAPPPPVKLRTPVVARGFLASRSFALPPVDSSGADLLRSGASCGLPRGCLAFSGRKSLSSKSPPGVPPPAAPPEVSPRDDAKAAISERRPASSCDGGCFAAVGGPERPGASFGILRLGASMLAGSSFAHTTNNWATF